MNAIYRTEEMRLWIEELRCWMKELQLQLWIEMRFWKRIEELRFEWGNCDCNCESRRSDCEFDCNCVSGRGEDPWSEDRWRWRSSTVKIGHGNRRRWRSMMVNIVKILFCWSVNNEKSEFEEKMVKNLKVKEYKKLFMFKWVLLKISECHTF